MCGRHVGSPGVVGLRHEAGRADDHVVEIDARSSRGLLGGGQRRSRFGLRRLDFGLRRLDLSGCVLGSGLRRIGGSLRLGQCGLGSGDSSLILRSPSCGQVGLSLGCLGLRGRCRGLRLCRGCRSIGGVRCRGCSVLGLSQRRLGSGDSSLVLRSLRRSQFGLSPGLLSLGLCCRGGSLGRLGCRFGCCRLGARGVGLARVLGGARREEQGEDDPDRQESSRILSLRHLIPLGLRDDSWTVQRSPTGHGCMTTGTLVLHNRLRRGRSVRSAITGAVQREAWRARTWRHVDPERAL